jgi:hypothetical protein
MEGARRPFALRGALRMPKESALRLCVGRETRLHASWGGRGP